MAVCWTLSSWEQKCFLTASKEGVGRGWGGRISSYCSRSVPLPLSAYQPHPSLQLTLVLAHLLGELPLLEESLEDRFDRGSVHQPENKLVGLRQGTTGRVGMSHSKQCTLVLLSSSLPHTHTAAL